MCRFISYLLLLGVTAAQASDVMVVTEQSPPYQMMINDEVEGSATQTVKRFLAEAGVSADFAMYPWARAYKKATSDANILIYSIAKSPERLEKFHWLIPVVDYNLGLVALSSAAPLIMTDWAQLKNHRIAVQRDDIAQKWLLSLGLVEGVNFIACSDINCSWQLLYNRNVDFIIETEELIAEMTRMLNQPSNSAPFIRAIPELKVTDYLAASIRTEPHILQKLLDAAPRFTAAQ
ncbi:MAG: amino acid ABC transporter substrate-binding protein [Paraglaciecola sp.]|nr:amino acid ABC transporter substrate-binding protein [Paraglaciecola sp.]